MFTAQILAISASNVNPPIPIDGYNSLPGVELWFDYEALSEVGLLCHLNSYAEINTGNLHVDSYAGGHDDSTLVPCPDRCQTV